VAELVTQFVAKRRPDWQALESLLLQLQQGRVELKSLTELMERYRRAASDCAHAQAHYPGADVTRYLNQLTVRGYGLLYQSPTRPWARLKQFFAADYPRAVREALPLVKLAGGIMALGAVMGGAAVTFDAGAAQVLVPENLRGFITNHALWTDVALDQHAPSQMAVQVFTNNLKVMFTAFALGLFGGVLTIGTLLVNGLLVGSVLAFCAQHGVARGLLDFMAAHGPVELSIIAIAGASGLMLGRAMMLPGELPRSEALRHIGPKAVQLVLGSVPFLIAIGIIEGFVSPGAFFPTPVKALLGAALGVGYWRYLLRAGT
jgi:uncharacterized membrane protein SpoIIM required for sporulation